VQSPLSQPRPPADAEAPPSAPREREQRTLSQRGDERGLAQSQIQATATGAPATLLFCMFF